MTKEDLIELAKERGIDIDPRSKKAVIAEALGIELDDEPAPAAPPVPAGLPEGKAKIRVLPMGDNKIGTGEGLRKNAEGRLEKVLAKRGDFMVLDIEIAERLERKGWAEIV